MPARYRSGCRSRRTSHRCVTRSASSAPGRHRPRRAGLACAQHAVDGAAAPSRASRTRSCRALIARLDVQHLGELGGAPRWLARPAAPRRQPGRPPPRRATRRPGRGSAAPSGRAATRSAAGHVAGCRLLRPATGPVGASVAAGDVLGWVEVLGVRQEVVSPRDGAGRFLAEAGRPWSTARSWSSSTRPRRAGDRPGRAEADAPAPPAVPRLMFSRVLIANRGEIALRVLRACRRHGHQPGRGLQRGGSRQRAVQLADEAICVGPAESRRSYLSAASIMSAALVTGCDAIHPGLRVPVRGRHLRGDDPGPRPDVHRPAAGGPGAVRVEGRHARVAGRGTACPPSRAPTACCGTTSTPCRRRSASATRC